MGHRQLLGHRGEAAQRLFRIGAAVAFFFGAVGLLLVFVLVLVLDGFLGGWRRRRHGFALRRQGAVVGVDVAAEDVGQAATFGGDALVFGEDAFHRAGELGNGAHHLADAFLDALGDFDLAFAGQQLHRTHFAHVHAHRVGGATDVAFHRGQGRSGLLGGSFVGVTFGEQQGIRIRSCLEYVDPHVVDHADDVFHLFRI
ncbi:hypothetical protein D3C84_411460 [compost metagenome]